jgi:hypothetical protein
MVQAGCFNFTMIPGSIGLIRGEIWLPAFLRISLKEIAISLNSLTG